MRLLRYPWIAIFLVNCVCATVSLGAFAVLRSKIQISVLQYSTFQYALTAGTLIVTVICLRKKYPALQRMPQSIPRLRLLIVAAILAVLIKWAQNYVFPLQQGIDLCMAALHTTDYTTIVLCLALHRWIRNKSENSEQFYTPKTLIVAVVAGIFNWLRQDLIHFVGNLISASIKAAIGTGVYIFLVRRATATTNKDNHPLWQLVILAGLTSVFMFLAVEIVDEGLPRVFVALMTSVQSPLDLMILLFGAMCLTLELLTDYWLQVYCPLILFCFLFMVRSALASLALYFYFELGSVYLLTPLNLLTNLIILSCFGISLYTAHHRSSPNFINPRNFARQK